MGQPCPTAVNLLINGKIVASATGNNSGDMDWVNWQVAKYRGQQAQIQVVDENDGSDVAGGTSWSTTSSSRPWPRRRMTDRPG